MGDKKSFVNITYAAQNKQDLNKISIFFRLQSPFPEVRGVPLKENRRIHHLSDVKQSLMFEAEEASSALSSPAVFHSRPTSPVRSAMRNEEQGDVVSNQARPMGFVRPSDIVELEKQVTTRSTAQLNDSGVEMTGVETEASKCMYMYIY